MDVEYAAGDDAEDHRFRFTAMASPCEVRLAGLPRALATAHAEIAIAEVRRIEHKYSRYRPDSIVSRINAAAGSGAAVEVDAETSQLLDFAAQLNALSEGRFDITSGVLRRAWDFRSARIPTPYALAEAVAQIGWPRVQRTPETVALPDAGMEIDFGGFGKEYAADRAGALVERGGAASGIGPLGGAWRGLGPPPAGSAWEGRSSVTNSRRRKRRSKCSAASPAAPAPWYNATIRAATRRFAENGSSASSASQAASSARVQAQQSSA